MAEYALLCDAPAGPGAPLPELPAFSVAATPCQGRRRDGRVPYPFLGPVPGASYRPGRAQSSGASYRPEEPKPPSPRAESDSSVASTGSAIATGVTTSWAMRAPASIRTVSAGSVFSSRTRISPR